MAEESVTTTGTTTSWHRADGSPTDNPDEAATVEVTTRHADGRVTHKLMRRASEGMPSD